MKKLITISLILILSNSFILAEDLQLVQNLKGAWSFSVGDKAAWSQPDYDDSSWDKINVPSTWESQGYEKYNGFAWYRKSFDLRHLPEGQTLYLVLGKIDDVDEVYVNGKLIGGSGKFPPHEITQFNKLRKYTLPDNILNEGGTNHIAVRVYDAISQGGISQGPIGIYVDKDYDLIEFPLADGWKFHLGNNREWKNSDYDDSNWDDIYVPSAWEEAGYKGYDGYAWYRNTFVLPWSLEGEELYIMLGRIDDIDEVYINGRFIGEVYDLEKDKEYRRSGYEYRPRRMYKIPRGVLQPGRKNVIAVQVYDGHGIGGIYEGPIGLTTSAKYKKYKSKYASYRSVWDIIEDYFYD